MFICVCDLGEQVLTYLCLCWHMSLCICLCESECEYMPVGFYRPWRTATPQVLIHDKEQNTKENLSDVWVLTSCWQRRRVQQGLTALLTGLRLALSPSLKPSVIDVCASDTSSHWPSGPCLAASLVASGGSSLWSSSPHTQPTWPPSWPWRGWCHPLRVPRT